MSSQMPNPRDMPLTGFGAVLQGIAGEDLGLGAPGRPAGTAIDPTTPPAQPHHRQDVVDAGIPFRRVPIYPPFANLAADPRVIYQNRIRPLLFGGNGVGAGVLAPQPLLFSQPTIVWCRMGAAFDASGAGLAVGRFGLELFGLFMQRNQGDMLDGTQTPICASAILGTGSQPALYAGNGLFFSAGTQINVTVQLFIANVRADVVMGTIEEYASLRR